MFLNLNNLYSNTSTETQNKFEDPESDLHVNLKVN